MADSGANHPLLRIRRRIVWALLALLTLTAGGTAGFCDIAKGNAPLIDCFYMTAITITTVGYNETVPVSHDTWGKLFTAFVAFTGFGTITFLFSSLTVFFLESDLDKTLRRRRMEKAIRKLHDHYIICGFGRVGRNVAQELELTNRRFVAVDSDLEGLEEQKDRIPGLLYLHGDASDDDVMLKADIADARGVFAVTGDDSRNLMIALTAKQLNPKVRVVARCHELRNTGKMRKAGADAIVSPDFTGGMRIASAMVRPHVMSFLDEMRKHEGSMRLEDIVVPQFSASRRLGEIGMRGTDYLLLAIRRGGEWRFNPDVDATVDPGDTLVVMATPEGKRELEAALLR